MPTPREEPYIWVSWLTKLLSGEAHCQWALWFRAHNTYDRQATDFDLVAWSARHAELVRRTVEALRAEGCEVWIEEQNKFDFEGRAATLGGKPDIVAIRGDEVRVVDCKTGAPKGADCMQVLVYMLALPYVRPTWTGKVITGEVRYSDDSVEIRPEELTPGFTEMITSAIVRAASEHPPFRTPSFGECRYCDITQADCPERVEVPPQSHSEPHELF